MCTNFRSNVCPRAQGYAHPFARRTLFASNVVVNLADIQFQRRHVARSDVKLNLRVYTHSARARAMYSPSLVIPTGIFSRWIQYSTCRYMLITCRCFAATTSILSPWTKKEKKRNRRRRRIIRLGTVCLVIFLLPMNFDLIHTL